MSARTGCDFFDGVYDATGNIHAMRAGLNYVANGGSYVLVSVVPDDLVFADPAMLGSLQRLQRGRLQARVDAAPLPDLRSPRPLRALLLAWVLGLAMTAALLGYPKRHPA